METKIYSTTGDKTTTFTLPEAVFGVTWNPDLVHEVVVSMQSNARAGTAHTKDRSEVAGGGKKPWRQKGTGRARHGSNRSPIWVGGGIAHGPRNEKDYSKKINKKARNRALASTLSKKLTDQEIILVEALHLEEPKTASMKVMLQNLAKASGQEMLASKRNNAALVILSDRNEAVEKSLRNFGNVEVVQAKDVNPVEVLSYKYTLIVDPEVAIATLAERIGATSK